MEGVRKEEGTVTSVVRKSYESVRAVYGWQAGTMARGLGARVKPLESLQMTEQAGNNAATRRARAFRRCLVLATASLHRHWLASPDIAFPGSCRTLPHTFLKAALTPSLPPSHAFLLAILLRLQKTKKNNLSSR